MAPRLQPDATDEAPGRSAQDGSAARGEASARWTFTYLVFDAQYRNLERATGTAQALLSAVTLSAALATPLLLIGVERSALDAVFGVLLVVYLLALGNAVHYSLRVMFTPPHARSPVHNVFHYPFLMRFQDEDKFSQYALGLAESQTIKYALESTWTMGWLTRDKVNAMRRAVRWTKISLGILGVLIGFRFSVAFWS